MGDLHRQPSPVTPAGADPARIDAARVAEAAKWSSLTEVLSKIIYPAANMVLARMLRPEVFGVVATVTMVTTFAEIFADSGFQKYVIQHASPDGEDFRKRTSVAFWTNLAVSALLWAAVFAFRAPLAALVGSGGLGHVLAIAALQLFMTPFSSVQTAVFRRRLDFRPLFRSRTAAALLFMAVTVPLAALGAGYWSIVAANLLSQLFQALYLSLRSSWKPAFFYRLSLLKEMASFCSWTIAEQLAVWFSSWIDAFLISSLLSSYCLGIYRQSLTMVNTLMFVVLSSVTPVLFSALSRLQDDRARFGNAFLTAQKLVAYLLFPLGAGVFVQRELAVLILFGQGWADANNIVGAWALTSAVRVVMVSLYSEAYRASGKPRLSLILQLLDIAFIVPACLIAIRYGFWPLVYARAAVRLDLVLPGLFVMQRVIGIRAREILRNLGKPALCALLMFAFAAALDRVSSATAWRLLSVLLSAAFYGASLFFLAREDWEGIAAQIKKLLPKPGGREGRGGDRDGPA